MIMTATALRRLARHEEALALLGDVEGLLGRFSAERESASSWLFMQYERGRVLVELGRFDEAYECFERVFYRQARDHHYPRAGSLRYLAAIAAARGEPSARDWLSRANGLADRAGPIGPLGATGAMALLRAPSPDAFGALAEQVEQAWRRSFDEPLDASGISAVLARIVY